MTRADGYAKQFEQVLDYIDRYLGEELSLDQLSGIANFSKYHFHRQFSAYCGISVFKYVQLMRLERASRRLVLNPLDRIVDVALDAGFESPESFARAFKTEYGQTPTEFRCHPAWKPWRDRVKLPSRKEHVMDVNIVDFETTRVAVLEHRGPPERVNESARIFIEWRKASGLSPAGSSRTFGVAYDNPDTTAPDDFRFDLCGSVSTEVPENPQGVINKIIPGGRCAVVRHLGSHDRIGEAAFFLYGKWLPDSGESLRDFPLFFHYLNLVTDTPEHELITDIYLPLK